jgi:hypothetical protein
MTDTAARYQRIHKHQAVLVLTERPGKTWRGIILSPGQSQSFIRYNEEGTLKEKKVANNRLVPVRFRPEKECLA